MNIEELRKKIDSIDDDILNLLEKRFELVKEVGKLKKASSSSIFVPQREKEVIERLSSKSKFSKEAIISIFREIMSSCRMIEHPIKIVYDNKDPLAILAAFSKFGICIELIGLPSTEAVIKATKENLHTYGVLSSSCNAASCSSIDTIHIRSTIDGTESEYIVLTRNT